MSEILAKSVASALNIDADELIASLKDSGGDFLPEEKFAKVIVAKFSEVSAAATESARDLAHRKGQSEMTKKFSKLIKDAGFENPDGLTGDEYFKAFTTWKAEQADTPPNTAVDQFTREQIEALPIVKSLKNEWIKDGATRYEALKKDLDLKQSEFEKFKSNVEENKVKEVARKYVSQALKKGNVILKPEGVDVDPNEREAAVFERLWSREKIGLDVNGLPIILGEDGTPATDPAFGQPIAFDDKVLGIAQPMFGVSTQDPTHGGSGVAQSHQGAAPAYTPTIIFRTQQEKDNYMATEPDRAKRLEALKSWQHQQEKAAGN